MDAVIQHLINWLVLGSIYALVALGFSMIIGVLDVIHFSHGDVAIVAPFVALAGIQIFTAGLLPFDLGWSLAMACALAIIITGLLGIVLEWLVIRRFRTAPVMMALVATVALGNVIRELIRSIYPQGSNPKAFPSLIEGSFTFANLQIPYLNIAIILIAVLMVMMLFYIMHHTPIGLYIRAVAEDRDIARLMAIRPNTVFAATFFIASGVGAIGGILFAGHAGVLRFDFGVQLGLIGFSAAVIGGLGSMPGAILGSLLISGIDALVQATMAEGAAYRLVFIFVLVIVALVLKPSGLLGRPVLVKV